MSPETASQLLTGLLWNCVLVSLPVLGVALLVGLLVSILQVVTQIQEMSLSFIPKLGAVVLVLVVLGPWVLNRMVAYARSLFNSIPSMFT